MIKGALLYFISQSGLIPPETPPALRRVRRRRFPGLMGMDPIEDVTVTF